MMWGLEGLELKGLTGPGFDGLIMESISTGKRNWR